MKKIIYAILTSATLSAANAESFASRYTDRLVEAARKAGWTETQIDKLQGYCNDYIRASTALHEFQQLNGLKLQKTRPQLTVNADLRDEAIQQIAKVAEQHHNRYQVLKKTVSSYDPSRTNLFARAARASMQTKLETARENASNFFIQSTNHLAQATAAIRARELSESKLAEIKGKITEKRSELEAKQASASFVTKSVYSYLITVLDSMLSTLN